jgi:N-acetylglucosaminyldiphosphoundecaprenol N-acetyl-beta-D-mannosaminyltransferase
VAPPIRVDVLGVGISCVDLPTTVDIFADWIAREQCHYVCVTGMHGVMESQRDTSLRDIHNASGLTTPDGMPMVWAGRRAGARISRVYGPDLMDAVLSRAVKAGWSSYFLGGSEDVLAKLVARLGQRYPGLAVAGYESPPFRPPTHAEDAAIVDRINAAGADIVWVGLGTPKQERFMASHRPRLDSPVLVGVGAAFDLIAGTLPQAPRWMQRSGLEWAFRLGAEPRRLWRRYLVNGPRFAVGMAHRPPRLIPPHTPAQV